MKISTISGIESSPSVQKASMPVSRPKEEFPVGSTTLKYLYFVKFLNSVLPKIYLNCTLHNTL